MGSLLEIGNVLSFLDGGLLLTDDELRKKMEEGSPVGKIGTMTEMVKASVEVATGAIEVTASMIAFIGKISGENDLVQLAGGLARDVALKVGNVITAVEVLHGALVIIDPRANAAEKIDGSVDVVSGMLWLMRKLPRMDWGGPAAIAIQIGYEFAKYALKENWNSSLGLETGLMQPALEVLQRDAITIAMQADEVVKARALASTETDASRRAVLERVEQNSAAQLGGDVDHLISDLQPPDLGADMTRSPGRYQILRDAMAPVLLLGGTKTPDTALAAAHVAIERVRWTLERAPKVIEAQTKGRGLEDVEAQDRVGEDRA
jgi:hypothetical protein